MTGAELAARMGVGQSTISGLEKGEVEGTITVSSLRRIARGLECELVYYLAPKDTLEASVRNRARQQLEREGSIPAGAGAGAGAGERAGERAGAGAEIEELVAKRIDQPGLWSDPPAR
jgi:transcriptional regulator with XRE-family HTH domain